MFEKNEFQRRSRFSAHLFKQIKMLTFLETSTNFQKDWRWHIPLCQCIQSRQLVKCQYGCHSPGDFSSSCQQKQTCLRYLTSHEALIIFRNDASNSHVPAFYEFLVNASHNKSPKHACKSDTASPENSLYFLLSST